MSLKAVTGETSNGQGKSAGTYLKHSETFPSDLTVKIAGDRAVSMRRLLAAFKVT